MIPFSKISFLAAFLAEGDGVIGEIFFKNNFSLRHHDDRFVEEEKLMRYVTPQDARILAREDAQKIFRPLKTAPTLRRGWLLQLKNSEEVLLALDFFYPAALDLYGAFLQKKLLRTPLRDTLQRQTGMYRITQSLTDEQAQQLIGRCCSEKKCLRRVLWTLAPDQEITTLPKEKKSALASEREIPLLCREACNLLVAAAREVVKNSPHSQLLGTTF